MFARQTDHKAKTAIAAQPKSGDVAPDSKAEAHANPVWESLALRGLLQAKLSVSQPDDPFEQEADRIAAQVTGETGPVVQRVCHCGGGCKECGGGGSVDDAVRVLTSRNPIGETPATAPSIVNEVLRSTGRALDSGTRDFMESRFGYDFGAVRLHSDAQAVKSAQAVNALAYTVGSDIVLGAGQQGTETAAGRRLLAHELTHVVQQSSGLGRQVLQRWTVEKCNSAQTVYVEDAFAKSFDDLTKAARLINQKPTTDQVKSAMWLAFRDDSEATVEKVRANIHLLKDKITSTRVTCKADTDSDCGTDNAYHSRGQDYGEIYFCVPRFINKGAVEQANILTHEASHKYLNVRDTGYFTSACEETERHRPPGDEEGKDSGTAGDNPGQRLNNADSYSCFVHFLVRVRAEGLATKSAEFKGDSLKLETKEAYVYTKTGTPNRSTFRLTGAPTNSGFRYKWKLVAGTEEFDLVATRPSGKNAGAFDDDTVEVYVSSDVRKQLAAGKGTVRCDIQLYRPMDGQKAPPEISRSIEVSIYQGQDPFDTSVT